MDIGSLSLGLALACVVVFYIAQPFLDKHLPRDKAATSADHWLHERELILANLRDLDFDHATGKTTDEDYAPQRAALMASGAEVLRQLDTLGLGAPAAASAAAEAPADDDLERAIAGRRKRPLAGGAACANCGASAGPADRFCPRCGAALLHCPHCGVPIQAGDQFCAGCGQTLSSTPAAVN